MTTSPVTRSTTLAWETTDALTEVARTPFGDYRLVGARADGARIHWTAWLTVPGHDRPIRLGDARIHRARTSAAGTRQEARLRAQEHYLDLATTGEATDRAPRPA